MSTLLPAVKVEMQDVWAMEGVRCDTRGNEAAIVR